MKCKDIMNTNLELLSEKDTIQRAALLMADEGVGFLPVCDSQRRALGVVTDRDLAIRALARSVAPATTSAAMVMTTPAITCPASADVRDAETLMVRERKSRLVITDDDGRVAGVLSLVDIVEKVPGRQALKTLRAVLWRDALGPRGGAAKGEPLLRDDREARTLPPPSDEVEVKETVFTGRHRNPPDLKEFPG
jgi:CBS domain-containing protein